VDDLLQSDVDGSKPDLHVSIGNEAPNESENVCAVQNLENDEPENTTRIEVYDSGCTWHITPYREAVTNFKGISPKSFQAANKQSFSAVGMGEMVIDIPNGTTTSQIKLTEVLYSHQVGYTLVSSGQLDEAGFAVTFADGKCVIRGRNGKLVGTIQKTGRGMYHVSKESESANIAADVLTLEQFHCRMGNIAPEMARRLVTSGLVTGVRLEYTPTGEPFFCESCIYAKVTRKPVSKAREGSCASNFGDEDCHDHVIPTSNLQSLTSDLRSPTSDLRSRSPTSTPVLVHVQLDSTSSPLLPVASLVSDLSASINRCTSTQPK
jgi:Pol polyprotein, beta-barrel domain